MAQNEARFRPDPEAVMSRAEALRWMVEMRWDPDVVHKIMYLDEPTLDMVRRLVYRFGPDDALVKIIGMQDDD